MSYYADDPVFEAPVLAELVEPPQPPLSIGHLLLWILGSAVVLGSYRWLAEPAAEDGARRLHFQLDQFARSLTLGGGVAALLIYARRWIKRDAPLPRQPGHWLLVVQGVNWPAYWLVLFSIYGLRGTPPDDQNNSFQRYVVTTALYYLWGAGVYAVLLACLRDAKRWRMFFAVCAVLPLLHALLWCCLPSAPRLWIPERSFVLVRMAITFVILGLCVLRDRAQRVPRDWMHFAGLGFYVFGVLMYLVIYLLQMFLAN